MKFVVTKSSDWGYEDEVEINTLEELKEFQSKSNNSSLIINFCATVDDKYDGEIEIYDGYRE